MRDRHCVSSCGEIHLALTGRRSRPCVCAMSVHLWRNSLSAYGLSHLFYWICNVLSLCQYAQRLRLASRPQTEPTGRISRRRGNFGSHPGWPARVWNATPARTPVHSSRKIEEPSGRRRKSNGRLTRRKGSISGRLTHRKGSIGVRLTQRRGYTRKGSIVFRIRRSTSRK